MKSLIALTVISVLLSNAYARIGTSESDCMRKYGKPTSYNSNKKRIEHKNKYRYKEVVIEITFKPSGKAVQMYYEDVKSEDIEAILEANASGMKWEKISENKWTRSNGRYSAEYKNKALIIRDENYYKKKEKQTARSGKKAW